MKKREDVINLLKPGSIGVELGVAQGEFSERALKSNQFEHFYSIDAWAGDRGHDVEQYKQVVKRLEPYRKNSTILKMRFDEALDLFPDNSLDFIYVDGYAHTAQENGTTLENWYRKLKYSGVFAGDDYHSDFRDNVTVIDNFKDRKNAIINVIDCHEPNSIWSEYPTWWLYKTPEFDIKDKSIAVVGNNTELFNHSLGEEIDSHDCVIRINRAASLFQPNMYNKSHGTRTDIWSVWRLDEYTNYNIKTPENIIQMSFWYNIENKKIKTYELQSLLRLIKMLNHENPSTGLMLLDFISQKSPASVSVYGFDWKTTPTWTDSNRVIDSKVSHDFQKEKQLCESYFQNQLGYRFIK